MFTSVGSRVGAAPRHFAQGRVYLNTAFNLSGLGFEKIPVDTVDRDSDLYWDRQTKRLYPKRQGVYQINGRVRVGTAGSVVVGIARNGALIEVPGTDFSSVGGAWNSFSSFGSDLVFCNGTSDYLELWAFSSTFRAATTGYFDTYLSWAGPF